METGCFTSKDLHKQPFRAVPNYFNNVIFLETTPAEVRRR